MREDRGSAASHYARLAARYDENWTHSRGFVRWMAREIVSALCLAPRDRVADVGCGTGLFARELVELVELQHQVLCVDPSERMLSRLPDDPRLSAIQASAEEVAGTTGGGPVQLPFEHLDAVLMKESVHHVRDRAAVLAGLAARLAPDGRLLVVMLPKRIDYPLFDAALELFSRLQPDPADVQADLRRAGLDTNLLYVGYELSFDTERYLSMVRERYMSLLSQFDDTQIGAGIDQIRARHREPTLTFTDRFAFVLGVRREPAA